MGAHYTYPEFPAGTVMKTRENAKVESLDLLSTATEKQMRYIVRQNETGAIPVVENDILIMVMINN